MNPTTSVTPFSFSNPNDGTVQVAGNAYAATLSNTIATAAQGNRDLIQNLQTNHAELRGVRAEMLRRMMEEETAYSRFALERLQNAQSIDEMNQIQESHARAADTRVQVRLSALRSYGDTVSNDNENAINNARTLVGNNLSHVERVSSMEHQNRLQTLTERQTALELAAKERERNQELEIKRARELIENQRLERKNQIENESLAHKNAAELKIKQNEQKLAEFESYMATYKNEEKEAVETAKRFRNSRIEKTPPRIYWNHDGTLIVDVQPGKVKLHGVGKW